MTGLVRAVLYAVLFVLAVMLAWNALTYLNFDPHYSFLRLKQEAVATGWYLPAYYTHVLGSAVILLAGFFQVLPGSPWRRVRLHRMLGRVYVYGILCIAAPGGLVMSFFIGRGPVVLSSFLLQVTLWFVFTLLALLHIIKGNLTGHRRFMLRSYSLTLAAITLRLYAAFTSGAYDLTHPAAYAGIAWASWVVNLAVCEVYLFLKPSPPGRDLETQPHKAFHD